MKGEAIGWIQKVSSFLRRYLEPGEALLVAYSGGPDSTALAVLLRDLGYRPHLAYLNHNLRGKASEEEEAWVQAFARAQGYPLYVRRLALQELAGEGSLQMRARRLRYAWLEELLTQGGFRWGATAHTRDDAVETLLYSLLRGREIAIWKGIPPRRGKWLRPLLAASRAQLIAYLRAKGVPYHLDASNYTPKYLRNQVRWGILPALRRIHPGVEKTLLEKASLYALQLWRLERLYQRRAQRAICAAPFGEELRGALPEDVFWAVAKRRWRLSYTEIQALWRLLKKGRSGGKVITRRYLFVRTPAGLEVGQAHLWQPDWPPLFIEAPGWEGRWGLWQLRLGEGSPPPGALAWDSNRIALPLQVRLWQKGDRFTPLGLEGHHKRVSDIWPEIGWYGFRRQHAFVVEDATGRIVGVAGYRVAHLTAPIDAAAPCVYLWAEYGPTPSGAGFSIG